MAMQAGPVVNGTSSTTVLEPTYQGYVGTTTDALILFEACLAGNLHHVPRRPHDRERNHLVRSGSVFIYEENSSGIKRWTDGVTWSPSRILGNFLIYRELDKPFPPGEKKRAMKKTGRRPLPPGRPGEPYPRQDNNGTTSSYSASASTAGFTGDRVQSDVERALVGSLVDSYGFKDHGLVKKTMSVTVAGVTHHLVSYYATQDVINSHLVPPSANDHLRFIRPRVELREKQNFRSPIDEQDHMAIEIAGGDPGNPFFPVRHTAIMAPSVPYGMPAPRPDFFQMPAHAYAATHPQQPNSIAAFPVQSASQQAYLPNPGTVSQLPLPAGQRQEDYTQFRGQAAFPNGFDPLNHGGLSTMQTGMPHLQSSMTDRTRSQSDQSQSAYRNSSVSSRSIATDTTSPLDPSSPANSFSRGGSFSLAGQMDGTNHSPLEHRAMSFDASIPRRESHAMPTPYYARSEQPSYYVNTPMPGAHASYPVSTWSAAPAPSQPQMPS